MPGVLMAVAVATNQVRLTLSETASQVGVGSALLPGNWGVIEQAAGKPLKVVSVELGATAAQWVLRVFPALKAGVIYEAGTAGLKTPAGDTYLAPARMPFLGLVSAQQRAAVVDWARYDLKLPTLGTRDTPAGTYGMTSRGDYALWAGPDARESDYLRRCMTPRGGFLHVPLYGVGLQPKRLISVQHQMDAKRELDEQLRREPGVQSVAPRLSRPAQGLLFVHLRVEHQDGLIESKLKVAADGTPSVG